MQKQTRRAASVVIYFIFILVIPVAITLNSVTTPVTVIQNSNNPTPLGYTISLSLFLFPMTALLFWMLRLKNFTFQKRAFNYTVILLAPMGIILDILFGNSFFLFENHNAVIGINFPAVGGYLPVEEIILYISGFFTVLLLYVWCNEYWFDRYNIPDYTTETADAQVSNDNGVGQSFSEKGSRLSGNSLILKTPVAVMRTQIGPIALGTDLLGVNTIEGTFCQPAGNCIPDELAYCPAEDD